MKELIQGNSYTVEEIDKFFNNEEAIKRKYNLKRGETIDITFNDGIVGTDASTFLNVESISIDLDEQTISVNDERGFIGLIHYRNTEEVVLYDHKLNGELKNEAKWIVRNSQLKL